MNRLDKVIQQARAIVQLLENIAAEEERLQLADWDSRLAEEKNQRQQPFAYARPSIVLVTPSGEYREAGTGQECLNYALLQRRGDPNQLELNI